MAPGQWDSEHDKNLLLLLLGLDIEVSRARFDEVATQMTNNVSGNACRYVSLSIILQSPCFSPRCWSTASFEGILHMHCARFDHLPTDYEGILARPPPGLSPWLACCGGAGEDAFSFDPGSYEDRTTELEEFDRWSVSNSHMSSPSSVQSCARSMWNPSNSAQFRHDHRLFYDL